MKKPLGDKLLQVIEKTENLIEKGAIKIYEFLKKECPELVKEIIRWNVAVNLLETLGIAVAGVIVIKIGEPYVGRIIYTSILFGIIPVVTRLAVLLKLLVAPRIFFIEYTDSLIKNIKKRG